MEFEGELYSERLRRQAQTAALQNGDVSWSTTDLPHAARTKLHLAWQDAVSDLTLEGKELLAEAIKHVSARSVGYELFPEQMVPKYKDGGLVGNVNDLFSLVEAQHARLKAMLAAMTNTRNPAPRSLGQLRSVQVAAFKDTVNEVFSAHLVGLHLHDNSTLVPIESHEMHAAVVAPTLFLLHSEKRFTGAEIAYQKALKELRNRDAGDAITDAGTALSSALKALGCSGEVLGDQLKSARNIGLVRGSDTPLTDAVIRWVATQRNQGEAHTAEHPYSMSDAWMAVHVVGALIIRLTEAAAENA